MRIAEIVAATAKMDSHTTTSTLGRCRRFNKEETGVWLSAVNQPTAGFKDQHTTPE